MFRCKIYEKSVAKTKAILTTIFSSILFKFKFNNSFTNVQNKNIYTYIKVQ